MKHLKPFALAVLTMAVCLVFTGCPNKPDESNERIIPDGIYKETVNIRVDRILKLPRGIDTFLFRELQKESFVTIRNGEFSYDDLCSYMYWVPTLDSNFVQIDSVRNYKPHPIYYSPYYCPDGFLYKGICGLPKVVNRDKIKIENPVYTSWYRDALFYDTITLFVPLVYTDNCYQFGFKLGTDFRDNGIPQWPAIFDIRHTLVYDRPLQ